MVQKNFNRFGLRREFNLSDLPSPTTALNNILNTPSMLGTESTFTVNDLNPIFGISFTNITLSTFNGLNGITVEFTVIDADGVITNESETYLPLIKIKTQLDSSFFSAGEPFFFGGDGPDAIYYDSNKIIRDPDPLILNNEYNAGEIVISNGALYRSDLDAVATEPLTPANAESFKFNYVRPWGGLQDIYFNDDFDPITGEVITITDNFWERGQFAYTGKLQASFLSLFGGVNWKGFYKPISSGEVDFQIRTTGSTIFKFQDKDELPNQLIRYGRIPITEINQFETYQNTPSLLTTSGIGGNGTRYSIDQIDEIVAAFNDPTRQLVKVSLPKKQRVSHGDIIFLEVSEGQLKSKQYRVLSHRKGTLGDSNLGEFDERDLVFFYIEVTEDFNLLNLDSNDLDAPITGSSEDFSNTFLTEAAPNASLGGLLATYRYGPYKRRRLKTYLNSVYHKLRIPDTEWQSDNSNPNRVYFTGVNARFYGLHFIDLDYIYDYRRYPGDVDAVARRWRIIGSDVAEEGETFTFNTNQQGAAYADLQLDTNYTPRPSGDLNDQFAYFLSAGTSITANFGNANNELWQNKGGNVTLTANTSQNCTLVIYDTDTNTPVTRNISNLTANFGGVYTEEYDPNPGTTGSSALPFNTGKKYLIYAPQSSNANRTFSFTFRGASGGGRDEPLIIDDDDDPQTLPWHTSGPGGYAAGEFTLNRNIWYVLIIGAQGEQGVISTTLKDGRGSAGVSNGPSPELAYSGGGFTALFDLELDTNIVSFSTANNVVIGENPDFGSTDPGANQPDKLILGGVPVVIAGGGGGASSSYGYGQRGGYGGGAFGNPEGGPGSTTGAGGGGTLTSGGVGVAGDESVGKVLQGGRGGDTPLFSNPGGGGGGGYYGGGGGRQENASTTGASQGGGGGSAIIAESTEQVSLDEIPNSVPIRDGGSTGAFSDGPDTALDDSSTIIFVARHGEETARIKTIRIDHFLSEFDDYAVDWTYYSKDEDIDPSTDNKYWYIYKKDTQQQVYGTLSYKFLYGRDYEFFEIGDFKRFIDNAVQAAGTSRETGIKQLAFGRPQLIDKGDQYNILYSLLPIQSVYQPKVNWFTTVNQGTCTLANNSRLLVADNATNFALGNYVVEDTFDSFRNTGTTNAFDKGTRVIELQTTGNQNIILSKSARRSGSSIPYTSIDHRGYVTTCVLTSTSNGILFEGDSSEIKVGMVVVVQADPTRTTYLRIAKINDINNTTYLELDLSINNIPATREPATGGFTPTNVTATPQNTSQYGWFKRWDQSSDIQNRRENPWIYSRETRIRWNNVTVYNESVSSSNGAINVVGNGLQDSDGNTYYPYLNPETDVFSAFVGVSNANSEVNLGSGWGEDYVSSFNVFRLQANVPLKAVIYNDKGIDIQEPLRQFCTNTLCTQNNFSVETQNAKTNYIMVRIKDFYEDTTLPYADLDQYFLDTPTGYGVPVTGLSYSFDIEGKNPQRQVAIKNKDVYNGNTLTSYGTGYWQGTFNNNSVNDPSDGNGNPLASVAWWTDAYTNKTGLNHGFETGAGPVTLNGIEGSKRIGGNHIYAKLDGTQLLTAMVERGLVLETNYLQNVYAPIGTVEGICRVKGLPYGGGPGEVVSFGEDLKYYLVVRPTENFMTWASSYEISPGVFKYNTINFQDFDSSLFDITEWSISRNWNLMLPRGNISTPNLQNGYKIGTIQELRQLYEAMNQGTPPTGGTAGTGNLGDAGNGYVDRIFQITSDITLQPTGSFTATINGASVTVNDFDMLYDFTGEGTPQQAIVRIQPASDPEVIEYVMPQGSFVKILSTNGKFVWYETYEQIQHLESIYTYPPFAPGETDVGEKWTLTADEAVQNAINNLPTKQLDTVSNNISGSQPSNWVTQNINDDWGNNFSYVHYRNTEYHVLPMPAFASQRFPGLRMISQNNAENDISVLQNTTNKLSVYTYAKTSLNRELCCPPLDTSPPFDSSPIGLSTTNLNPDMYIDGLINVRSITANHPINKFYSTVGLSNSDLPVTDKLELLFGDTKYKLLLGDTDPTTL